MSQHERVYSLLEFMDDLHPEALGNDTHSGQTDGHFPCLMLTGSTKDWLVFPCIALSHLWFSQALKTVKSVGTEATLPEFESLFCTY